MSNHTELINRLREQAHEWSNYVVEDRAPCTLSDYVEPAINALTAAVEALKREKEALHKDAERYRWLREQGTLTADSRHPHSWRCLVVLSDMGGELADEAIDTAKDST